MGLGAAPIKGAANPVVAALVAEVLADLTNPLFDPTSEDASSSDVTIPVADDSEDQGVWRNIADDVRTTVRDQLIARGVTPPEGLVLKGSRDGAQLSYYYGQPTTLQLTKGKRYIGPKGSTGRVAAEVPTEEVEGA